MNSASPRRALALRPVRSVGFSALSFLLCPVLTRSAHAHGFGQRFDLPLPLDMYLLGAASTVVLSFVLVTLFVRSGSRLDSYPRLNLLRWRVPRLLDHPLALASNFKGHVAGIDWGITKGVKIRTWGLIERERVGGKTRKNGRVRVDLNVTF